MDFAKIEVEKPVAAVTAEDIDKSLERLSDANPLYKPKDGAAAEGDRLIIDFEGTLDGEPFKGGSAEDAQVILGGGNFIPGFEEGLTGAKAGEERSDRCDVPGTTILRRRWPERQARFEVTVKEVASQTEPDDRRRFRQEPWA